MLGLIMLCLCDVIGIIGNKIPKQGMWPQRFSTEQDKVYPGIRPNHKVVILFEDQHAGLGKCLLPDQDTSRQ